MSLPNSQGIEPAIPKRTKKPFQKTQPQVKFSMRAKLTIGILSIALLTMGVMAYAIINSTRTALIETANQNLLGTAKQISTEIDTYLQANISNLQAQAQLPAVQNIVSNPELRSGLTFQTLRDTLASLKEANPYILSYALLDTNGVVITDTRNIDLPDYLGTDPQIQRDFKNATVLGQTYVSLLKFDEGKPILYLAASAQDTKGNSAGLLVARYDTKFFQDLVEKNNGLAGTGSHGVLYAQIYDNYIHLAHGSSPELISKSIVTYSSQRIHNLREQNRLPNWPDEELSIDRPDLITNLEDVLREPYFTFTEDDITSQAAVIQLEEKPWFLAYYQPQETFLAPIAQQITLAIILAVIVAGITAMAAFLMARNFSTPLIRLAGVAQKVGQGDLDARASIKTQDEIGVLAATFNATTSQLQQTLDTQEERIAERTKDLARRTIQLQTASEVARDATTIRDRDKLLNHVTQLIADRFNFYHAGIFLSTGKYAVLEASNSAGGQRMLARGHRLEIGETGIVGYTAATGQARIALDVGEDATFFDNPDLPETRSEMALPLKIEDQVIGVLDVQSKRAGAFTAEDIDILQVLADQIAIALDNARLLDQSRKALAEIQNLYGEQSRASWRRYLEIRPQTYRYLSGTVTPLTSPLEDQESDSITPQHPSREGRILSAPITVAGQNIGTLSLRKDEAQPPWTEDDLDLIQETLEQISTVLETVHLYEDTQRRATSERLTSEITSRMRETLDIDTIMKTAAEEIRQTLDLPEVAVQLFPPQKVSSNEEKEA